MQLPFEGNYNINLENLISNKNKIEFMISKQTFWIPENERKVNSSKISVIKVLNSRVINK